VDLKEAMMVVQSMDEPHVRRRREGALGQTGCPQRAELVGWLRIAVGSLLLAGLMALGLIAGRAAPWLVGWADPGLFRRVLVVHVNLALIVWFYAALAGLAQQMPWRAGALRARWTRRGAAAGVGLMCVAALLPDATPILANYVPVLDHPLFLGGLGLFGVSAWLACVPGRMRGEPGSSGLGRRVELAVGASQAALLLAGLTFAAALWRTPRSLAPEVYYELVCWGGGHTLQVASVALMMGMWTLMAERRLGRAAVSADALRWALLVLVAPHLVGLWLALGGTTRVEYLRGATRLMQLGVVPAALWLMWRLGRALVRAPRPHGGHMARCGLGVGLVASWSLLLLGIALGATLSPGTTMVPAHYHAAIGAVTISLMAAAPVLLGARSWGRLQPALFGAGQMIFALGFALAGWGGLGRKVYGGEQHVRSALEWTGLGVMGAGGLLAVGGGFLFLALAIPALRDASRGSTQIRRR
jgi:cytochrome c oxidase subunit I